MTAFWRGSREQLDADCCAVGVGHAGADDGSGQLYSSAKIPTIAAAVNAACDKFDGVQDGILNDPGNVIFDPSIIECKDERGRQVPDRGNGP